MNYPATRLTFLGGSSYAPRFSPDGSKIVFASRVNRREDIYRMNADGSDLRPLTTTDGTFCDATFSPDGSQIAFVRADAFYEEIHNIWIMDADGANQRPLTTTTVEYAPQFSPDGQWITFASGRDRAFEIYRMRADGSEQQRLTVAERSPDARIGAICKNLWPRYLADGGITFLAIYLGATGDAADRYKSAWQGRQLHRMNADGSERRPLVDTDQIFERPGVAEDGRLVAFCTREDGCREGSLSVVFPDGSGLKRLEGGEGYHHAFNPAGDRIVFASFRDHRVEPVTRNYDLYCLLIADGHLERLTDNLARDTHPIFSPSGEQIAFSSDRDGTFEIYTMPYEG